MYWSSVVVNYIHRPIIIAICYMYWSSIVVITVCRLGLTGKMVRGILKWNQTTLMRVTKRQIDEKVSAVRPFPPPTTGVLPEVCFRRHDSGKALKICELGKTYWTGDCFRSNPHPLQAWGTQLSAQQRGDDHLQAMGAQQRRRWHSGSFWMLYRDHPQVMGVHRTGSQPRGHLYTPYRMQALTYTHASEDKQRTLQILHWRIHHNLMQHITLACGTIR